jgi:hypothetical protein
MGFVAEPPEAPPATLRIAEIDWDANGWPYSGGP